MKINICILAKTIYHVAKTGKLITGLNMTKIRILNLAMTLACLLSLKFANAAETWHLDQQGQWQSTQQSPQGMFMLEISRIKQLINDGDINQAVKKVDKLKQKHPELAGPDLDDFMKAQKFYASGKWGKAAEFFEKFLNDYPDSWLYDSALETYYQIGLAFLNGGKRTVLGFLKLPAFDEGVEIMKNVGDRAGDAPIAKKALITLAQKQRKRKKFLDEYETWALISSKWPTGEIGKMAQLAMAYSLHSDYRGPGFDAAGLTSARTYYENVQTRYENLAQEHAVDSKMEIVDEQLAYKKYNIGLYYERAELPQAAEIEFEKVVNKWPKTQAGELARAKLAVYKGETQKPAVEKGLGRIMFDTGVYALDEWVSKFDLDWLLKDEE